MSAKTTKPSTDRLDPDEPAGSGELSAFDWRESVTKATISLSVPQPSNGELVRKIVGFTFEFDIDVLMEVYRQNLLSAESEESTGEAGGLRFNVERAQWAVFREFCSAVHNFAGMDELTLAKIRTLFEKTPRLKSLAQTAVTVLVAQLQTREAKAANPLRMPAS